MEVCQTIRARKKRRLDGLAGRGYCAVHRRYFFGVREHLILTPQGRVRLAVHLPGQRHDVNGLYALLKTHFQGRLLTDNGYWPKPERRVQLERQGIEVWAESRSNWDFQYPPITKRWLKYLRSRAERHISQLNQHFHAGQTRCRCRRHFLARRSAKFLTYNTARHINAALGAPSESLAHYRLAV